MLEQKIELRKTYLSTKLVPNKLRIRFRFIILLLFCLLGLSGCAKPKPHNINNICSIFDQYPEWQEDTRSVEKRWKIPTPIQMSIVYQESSFNANTKPPRKKLLWLIPWKRESTSFGYAQAVNGVWGEYEDSIGDSARRTNFADSVDFIGWYSRKAYKRLGIPPTDAYRLYLAYHEGLGGYAKRSYLKKPWLLKAARLVSTRARIYRTQLSRCV